MSWTNSFSASIQVTGLELGKAVWIKSGIAMGISGGCWCIIGCCCWMVWRWVFFKLPVPLGTMYCCCCDGGGSGSGVCNVWHEGWCWRWWAREWWGLRCNVAGLPSPINGDDDLGDLIMVPDGELHSTVTVPVVVGVLPSVDTTVAAAAISVCSLEGGIPTGNWFIAIDSGPLYICVLWNSAGFIEEEQHGVHLYSSCVIQCLWMRAASATGSMEHEQKL